MNAGIPPVSAPAAETRENAATSAPGAILRISSASLMQSLREIEIDHEGRIYRLRITHSNKLILTA